MEISEILSCELYQPDEKEDLRNESTLSSSELLGKSFLNETLITCEICFEILCSPVNCAPCNHKFCSACMYRWLDDHHTCPKCRVFVREITKDIFVNDICQEYLKYNPARSRTKEALEAQEKAELEYLENLIKRARYYNYTPPPVNEEYERLLARMEYDRDRYDPTIPGGLIPKRLFLNGDPKFRENEWMTRARNLREIMNLPPREWSPVPDRTIRCHVHGDGDSSDSMDDGHEGSRARRQPFRNVQVVRWVIPEGVQIRRPGDGVPTSVPVPAPVSNRRSRRRAGQPPEQPTSDLQPVRAARTARTRVERARARAQNAQPYNLRARRQQQ